MTPEQLEDWLEIDESKAAGQQDDVGESTGHASGRRIVRILRTSKSDLDSEDAAHMNKVLGYVARHTAQRLDKSDDELAHARRTGVYMRARSSGRWRCTRRAAGVTAS